jgi:hypothetical protein
MSCPDHPARHIEIRGDWLLHQNVLTGPAAQQQRFQSKLRKSADIDVINAPIAAHLLVRGKELGAILLGELAASFLVSVRANHDFKTEILVRLSMFMRHSGRSDQSDFQFLLLRSDETLRRQHTN